MGGKLGKSWYRESQILRSGMHIHVRFGENNPPRALKCHSTLNISHVKQFNYWPSPSNQHLIMFLQGLICDPQTLTKNHLKRVLLVGARLPCDVWKIHHPFVFLQDTPIRKIRRHTATTKSMCCVETHRKLITSSSVPNTHISYVSLSISNTYLYLYKTLSKIQLTLISLYLRTWIL